MDARAKAEAIKARAHELGFDKVGIAEAGVADPHGRLKAWLDRGFAGQMNYMARTLAEREDPRRLVPNARSVIALAISYWAPEAETKTSRIARYARSDDYHRVLQKKLHKLRRFVLGLEPGASVKPSVDTSAVLEREWAARAGIGWTGKSTMTIAEDLGTYTFLASLITSVELEVDEPHPDRCGSCTACLEACPTHAFVGPYELDAQKCIGYWTVEHRGEFTADAPAFHGWIAGCDVCQEVCPWNKFAQPTRERRFRPRPELVTPNLETLSNEALATIAVAGTALQRTGGASIRRNTLRVIADEGRGTEGSA